MTPEEKQYFSDIAEDILSNGGIGDMTIEEAFCESHKRRVMLSKEMASGKTKRAIVARRAIAASIWLNAQRRKDWESADRFLGNTSECF